MTSEIGRFFMILGAVLIVAGAVIFFADRIPFLGRLPGDFVIKRKNVTIYFPLGTSVILSVLITLALRFLSRR